MLVYNFSQMVNHQVTVPGTALGDQVVFVRPPPVVYKHNVQIQGSGSAAQKTKIFVLPQKSQVLLQDNRLTDCDNFIH